MSLVYNLNIISLIAYVKRKTSKLTIDKICIVNHVSTYEVLSSTEMVPG